MTSFGGSLFVSRLEWAGQLSSNSKHEVLPWCARCHGQSTVFIQCMV